MKMLLPSVYLLQDLLIQLKLPLKPEDVFFLFFFLQYSK